MRTEAEHELDPLLPYAWEMVISVLLFGLVAAVAVLVAVLLSRRMRR